MIFQKDDVLVLYTDGISEAANYDGEEFGYERMERILNDNAKFDAISIQKMMIQKLKTECGDQFITKVEKML